MPGQLVAYLSYWVVVKIMVPFSILIVRHLVFRGPERGPKFLTTAPPTGMRPKKLKLLPLHQIDMKLARYWINRLSVQNRGADADDALVRVGS